MKSYVVVDNDGFIVDASYGEHWAWQRIGAPFTLSEVQRASAEALIERTYPAEVQAAVYRDFRAALEDPKRAEFDMPLPGAVEAMHRLQKEGLLLAITTGRHERLRASTCHTLHHFGFPGFYDPDRVRSGEPVNLLYMRNWLEDGEDPRVSDTRTKDGAIKDILRRAPIVAGGGDRPADSDAFQENNVPAFIIPSYPRDWYATRLIPRPVGGMRQGMTFVGNLLEFVDRVLSVRDEDFPSGRSG